MNVLRVSIITRTQSEHSSVMPDVYKNISPSQLSHQSNFITKINFVFYNSTLSVGLSNVKLYIKSCLAY